MTRAAAAAAAADTAVRCSPPSTRAAHPRRSAHRHSSTACTHTGAATPGHGQSCFVPHHRRTQHAHTIAPSGHPSHRSPTERVTTAAAVHRSLTVYDEAKFFFRTTREHVLLTKGYAMMSIGEELKSTMPSFMQFCSRVDQGNVQEDWWNTGSDAEAFAHNNKADWLSDSDSQNTIICSTTSSSPGPSLGSTSTSGGQKPGSSKGKGAARSKDTPAGQKPAQVVARRNARERRRVQAVNWAFSRLRKVVPLEENKSKRMSKVKTLQLAIEYINQLQGVLSLQNSPVHNHPEPDHHQLLTTADINLFSDVQYKLEPGELQFRMPPNFYSQLLTDNQN